TPCVTFSSSADAIRASSCVNLSNLCTLSSISVFPANFLKYLLNRPRFASFVMMARIMSTSTIISTIISVIAIVGVMPV
ncbi:hypothetical protein V8E52_005399, partial [Russula decolorans]